MAKCLAAHSHMETANELFAAAFVHQGLASPAAVPYDLPPRGDPAGAKAMATVAGCGRHGRLARPPPVHAVDHGRIDRARARRKLPLNWLFVRRTRQSRPNCCSPKPV